MDFTSVLPVRSDEPAVPAIITSTNSRLDMFPPLPERLNYQPVSHPISSPDINQVMTEDKNHVMLWNPMVNQPIQIVSNAYKTHNFHDLYSKYISCIAETDLNLTDMKVEFKTNWNDSSLEVWISLPAHNFNKQLGEESFMLIRLRDSHNASSARSITAELVRSFCYNGCVWGTTHETYIMEKHTKNADPVKLALSASRFPNVLANHAELLRETKSIPVAKDDAFEFFKQTICGRTVGRKQEVNERELERCEHRWAKYPKDGDTLWRTYNVLTDYSTHYTTNASDEVHKAEERRQKVRSALRHEWWKNKLSNISDVELIS